MEKLAALQYLISAPSKGAVEKLLVLVFERRASEFTPEELAALAKRFSLDAAQLGQLLAALRLLRTVVGVRDEQLDLFVARANLLAPALALFARNEARNNMANSAVLEMVDFIRRKNAAVLIRYIAETFGPQL